MSFSSAVPRFPPGRDADGSVWSPPPTPAQLPQVHHGNWDRGKAGCSHLSPGRSLDLKFCPSGALLLVGYNPPPNPSVLMVPGSG